MTYVHRCLIVPAALAPQARLLTERLAGPPGAGMFITPLSPTGAAPPTHFISSGLIEDTFAAVLADPQTMFSVCQQAGVDVTLAACQALLGASDVSENQPFDALARLNLRLVQSDL